MYLVADINVDICAATSCKLCTQYCPVANTILYSDNLGKDKGEGLALFVAWTKGDLTKLAAVEDDDPRQRILMLDNRNNAWLPQIEAMLKEPKTHLVTVGAAHLAGPTSVIHLLCAKGWKVERIQTGPTPPPPACRLSRMTIFESSYRESIERKDR